MPRRKYRYIHLLNNVEVDKGTFWRHLANHCCEVLGNSDNPLLNVLVVDDKKLDRLYNRLKRTGQLHIFIDDETGDCEDFQIKKVEEAI